MILSHTSRDNEMSSASNCRRQGSRIKQCKGSNTPEEFTFILCFKRKFSRNLESAQIAEQDGTNRQPWN